MVDQFTPKKSEPKKKLIVTVDESLYNMILLVQKQFKLRNISNAVNGILDQFREDHGSELKEGTK